jgi:hypothetical protein
MALLSCPPLPTSVLDRDHLPSRFPRAPEDFHFSLSKKQKHEGIIIIISKI